MGSNVSDVSSKTTNYRSDIDGLRGISCLFILLFHAFNKILPGGFIGVDIFFVISGFLITRILLNELYSHDGKLNFVDFYMRRIRRIFPALIFCLIVCMMIALIILIPSSLSTFGKHLLGGATYISNFILWSEVGYFDKTASLKPLLHLWSLGIEEQFYIFWPFFLWIIYKLKFKFSRCIIAFILISFAIDLFTMHSSPAANFYSPLSRAWELSVGGFIAYMMVNEKKYSPNLLTRNALSFLGLVMIFVALIIIEDGWGFPGYMAILPVIGTALVIYAGEKTKLNTLILSSPILVWFGLISYPLYLWHWPILSFCYILKGEINFNIAITVILLSIFLAWFTYRFIEPFFRYGKYQKNKAIILFCSMSLIGIIGLGMWYYYWNISENDDYKILRNEVVLDTKRCQKIFPDWKRKMDENQCAMSNVLGYNSVAIIGDSHARHLYAGLKDYLKNEGIEVFPASCAIPFLDIKTGTKNKKFPFRENGYILHKKALQHIIEDDEVKVVIMAHDPHCSYNDIVDMRNVKETDTTKILRNGLARSLDFLKEKEVIFILDNPTSPIHPDKCNSALVSKNECKFLRSYHDNDRIRNNFNKIIKSVAEEYKNVSIIDLSDVFCDSEYCYLAKNGKLLYSDKHHLSTHGSVIASKVIGKIVKEKLEK